jgi:chaperonin GroES
MAKFKISPLDDRVVIEQSEAEERTSGGIYLPEQAKEKPTRGKVVAAGPGKLLDSGNRGKMSVKIGDEVFYGKYSGTEVEVTGKKYTVLRESDILAVIEN